MRWTVLLLTLFFTVTLFSQEIHIIPQPAEMKKGKGVFLITKQTVIAYDDFTKNTAYFLQGYLKEYYGLHLRLTMHNRENAKAILLMSGGEQEKKGFYVLQCDNNGISIGGDSEGVFYGIQTLIQLIPIQNPKSEIKNIQLAIPQLSITDYPRFAYRGMHLDVCRNFFDVSFVKKYIDYLALHKLNTLHWHLTEDQGWRIEIKKYPKLTSVGGYRNGTILGRYPGQGNDGKRYGGYYTQDEIKEVVQYAADRYITVIPEIEMPGHSSAAIAAYNELSCFPEEPTIKYFPKDCTWSGDSTGKQVQQTWGVFDDVYCAGKENTFKFLEDVLDEVIPLFPSKYVHIGGDESPKENWKRCPNCQKRMKDNNLKDEHELQSYFIQRMEKYLNSKGKTIIGWDEILEGGLAPNAVVMSWRGEEGGIAAAKQKHSVIMSPTSPVYFDYTQSKNEDSVTIGGYNPIEKVYAYEPVPKELNDEEAKYILGAQANLWSEYLKNPRKVEYMIFPRMAALSEVLWSTKEKRNWKDFEKRLPAQFKRYDLWKANYSKAYYNISMKIEPTSDYSGIAVSLLSKHNQGNIKVQTVKKDWPVTYSAPIILKESNSVTGMLYDNKTEIGSIHQTFHFNKATGKKITLTNPASNKYPGDGAFTLVNGVQNEKGLASAGEFLGFDGTDCEAIIDLGKETAMSMVYVHMLDDKGAWIWPPSSLGVMTSNDGKDFSPVVCSNPQVNTNTITCEFLQPAKARYIKILVQNQGTIPAGYPGAGSKPWLFVDEIEIL